MSTMGDNHLAVLACEIRTSHAGVKAAAEVTAAHAIAAGQALIEAKALVAHGQWLPWLERHCGFAERTAQLYMHIAEKGTSASLIAALGLKAAAGAFVLKDDFYDPFHHCGIELKREWLLYACFIGTWEHCEWLLQKQFVSPDEWVGPVGDAQRRLWGMRPMSNDFCAAWVTFRVENSNASEADLEQRICAVAGCEQTTREAAKRPRRRRSTVTTQLKSHPLRIWVAYRSKGASRLHCYCLAKRRIRRSSVPGWLG